MASNQEGLSIVDEKLTYTNVVEPLDEDSVLSEYVITEDLDSSSPEKDTPTVVVSTSKNVSVFKDGGDQTPPSPNGSDLSIQPDELSESILKDLPLSPSLSADEQVHEQVSDDDANKNDSSVITNKVTSDECDIERPMVDIQSHTKSHIKASLTFTSWLFPLTRLALLAILVLSGLCTRFPIYKSFFSSKDSFEAEEVGRDTTKPIFANDKDIVKLFEAEEDHGLIFPSQDHCEELTVAGHETNSLLVIPSHEKPESGWGSFFVHLFAMALSMCSVTLLTNEQSAEEKIKCSRFDDIRDILVHCKKCLRRNGRRSRKESELNGYNMTNYERLSIEDLQKILILLDKPAKGDKQRLIQTIITEYSRQLASLTEAEIIDLLKFHNIDMFTKQKKSEMIKALTEAAF